VSHETLYRLIQEYDTITIFGHVFPDGDCYGSQIGLKEALLATFPTKKVYALGSGYPAFHALLGSMDLVDDQTVKRSLALVLDVADTGRIEDQRFLQAALVFKIDHHIPTYNFGQHQWIDTTTLAVAEMIARFVKLHHLKINHRGASALALGMITDSNRFQFGHIRAETFNLMGTLLTHGADLKGLYRVLYDKSRNEFAFERLVHNQYVITEAGFIYCHITRPDLLRFGLSAVSANLKVNLLAHVESCPVWAFFTEDEGLIRCEIRSDGLDIQPIALAHNGGGHQQASGFRLEAATQIPDVVQEIDQLIKEKR
jgi:phosphoesterase RecJ-like protein